MNRIVIWDAEGRILHACENDDEAADVIKECGYTEMYRNRSENGDMNILVSEF